MAESVSLPPNGPKTEAMINPEGFASLQKSYVETLGVHPDLAASLNPDSARLLHLGIAAVDDQITRSYTNEAMRLMRGSIQDHTTLQNMIAAHKLHAPGRNAHVESLHMAGSIFKNGTMAFRELLRTTGTDFLRSHIQSTVTGSESFLYQPYASVVYQLEENKSEVVGFSDKVHPDISVLFPEIVDPELISTQALYERLSQRNMLDMSQETLDARLELFTSTAQLSLLELYLSDWTLLASVSDTTFQQVREHFRQLPEHFAKKDLPATRSLGQDILSTIKVDGSPNTQLENRMLVRAVLERLELTLLAPDRMLKFFAATYLALGHTPPKEVTRTFKHLLRDGAIERSLKEQGLIKNTESGATLQTSEITPDELFLQIGALDTDIKAFAAPWHMSSKDFKKAGYTSLQHKLVMGGGTQSDLLGIPKEEARARVSVLHTLHEQAQRQADIVATTLWLGQATREQRLLTEKLTDIRQATEKQAAVKDVRPLTEVFDLQSHITTIKEQWPSYRKVILDEWPKGQGREVVTGLEVILFSEA